ncbi:MAG: hypothetical protein AB1793_04600 [Candidatus Thermoplasmatota archaeon]
MQASSLSLEKRGFWEASREAYRFILAMAILIIFGMLLVATMAGGYTDPTVIAGMFSGWIVAIIGFYFMDEVSARSTSEEVKRAVQSQYDDAFAAHEENLRAKDTVIQRLKDELVTLSYDCARAKKERDEIINQQKEALEKLINEVEERRAFAKQFSDMLTQLGPKPESVKEG